jgi:hypothetical protein
MFFGVIEKPLKNGMSQIAGGGLAHTMASM